MIHIATYKNNEWIPIQRIADELNISFHFLTKVLQQLTNAGLLHSQRGAKGGVQLAKVPSEISLYDIVTIIDGDGTFYQCLLGLPGCGRATPCPVHDVWSKLRTTIALSFNDSTLDNLSESSQSLLQRLASPKSAGISL